VELHFESAGRNSKLLLNVPPTREGLLHETDVARLREMHERLTALFARDVAAGRTPSWRVTGPRTAEAELDLGRPETVGIADLAEDVEHGQVVARYTLEGANGGEWRALSRGATIGFRKLDRFPPQTVRRVRLRVLDAVEAPRPLRIALHAGRDGGHDGGQDCGSGIKR
jgi:alpha-L-fucosidase